MPRSELLTEKARRYYDILTELNDIACEDNDEELTQAIYHWMNDNFKYDKKEKEINWG